MKKIVHVFLASLLLVGCATTPNVMYSADHKLTATGFGENAQDSASRALSDAKAYCSKQGHSMVQVLKEATFYQGKYDPSLSQSAQAAGKILSGIARANDMNMSASSDEWWANRQLDSIGRTTSNAFSSHTDYKTMVEFSCQD